MPPVLPSVQKLKAKVFDYLSPRLASLARVSPVHPNTTADVKATQGWVVVSYLYDGLEGQVVTRAVLYPWLRFTCWHTSEPLCSQLMETLVEELEQWTAPDLTMTGQRVNSINRRGRFGPMLDNKLQLWLSSIDVGFSLTRV